MTAAKRAMRAGVPLAVVLSLITAWTPDQSVQTPSARAQDNRPAVAPQPGGLVESAPLFGFTEGSFAVADDGAATYRVPLWTPEGRGGLEPPLSLDYDSNGGNGIAGMGWRLDGISSIRPCPRTQAQDGVTDGVHFDGGDAYCLDGMRLLPVSEPQLPQRFYRTERESFGEITAFGMQDNVPDYFTVVTKSGKTLYFGQNPKAQLKAYPLEATNNFQQPGLRPASDEPVTVEWSLDRIVDRNDNDVFISYQSYLGYTTNIWGAWLKPDRISYGPNRSVRFDYELRPDYVDRFTHGVHLRTIHRLAGITMYGGPEGGEQELLRDYRLSYRNDSITGRSLLTSVQECDQDGVCKMPQTLSYSRGGYDFEDVDTTIDPDLHAKLLVGDINGDGRDDLLYPDPENDWKMRLSTGNGFGAETDAGIGRISPTELGDIRTVDIDGDGRMDVMAQVQRAAPPTEPIDRKDWVLYQSDGTKFVPYIEDVDDETADDNPDPVYFGDLDGNGMPDFLSATYDESTREGGPWYYRLNTGKPGTARWADKVTSSQPRLVSVGSNMLDIDGDGRTELVGWNGEPGDDARTKTFGLTTAGTIETPIDRVNITGDAGSRHFGDVNGDGLQDIIYPYHGLRAQLNSAKGFGPTSTTPDDYVIPDDETDGSGSPLSIRYSASSASAEASQRSIRTSAPSWYPVTLSPVMTHGPSLERSRLTRVATFSTGRRGGASAHSASMMRSTPTVRRGVTASRANSVRALRLPTSTRSSVRPVRQTVNTPTT